MRKETIMDAAPMKDSELGRYVCVIHPLPGCLHSPDATIRADGVWVKAGQMWSSGHADCYQRRALYDQTAPAYNCVTYPGDGPHYLTADGNGCQWCGKANHWQPEREDTR